jgi:hypothetical protein
MLAASDLEPLILADGTRIDPVTGKGIKDKTERKGFTIIPSASEAQAIVAKTRRSIADLPMPSNQMNALSLVLFYKMYGLSNNDVAITVGISLEQVKNIQALEQYKNLFADIQKSVLEHEADDIREFFKQNAKGAASKIVEIAQEDEGVLGFKASQDILDRAGHRPADVVEHRHTMENSLRIEYIDKKAAAPDIPSIETTYRDVTDGNRS